MHDGLDITTVIFAVLAVFVVWKLKSVLGTRVDIDRRPSPPPRPDAPEAGGKVIPLPGAAHAPPPGRSQTQASEAGARTDKGRAALQAIVAADPKFNAERFVSGAKVAYEMIIVAFANGDRRTLENLLSPDVLASFVGVIDRRESSGEQASTKIISIDSVEIVDGGVRNGNAQLSTRISAKMSSVVRDKAGELVSGDPDIVVSTDDLWTFARDVASSDPTWRLIATESHQS
jgi:predicted lipid-binding transport protein (Tim44 family)